MADILPLLDELRTIAQNGLHYAENPYDRERYERLMALTTQYYGASLDLPPAEVRVRLARDLGYVTPKVGADIALFDAQRRILLELRADDRRWCLPCGWVEPNESPAETVVREAREELGLEVRVQQLVDVVASSAGARGELHTMIAVLYLGEVTGGTLAVSHESLDARYWAIEDVPTWHGLHCDYALAAYRMKYGG